MTKAGKIMFFVGLVLSVLSLIAVVWGTTQTVRVAQNMMDDTITVSGDTTVPMNQGGTRMVLTEGAQAPTCTVTAPDGSDVAVTQDAAFQDLGDAQVQIVGSFTAVQSGEHTITCDAPAQLTPELSASSAMGVLAAGLVGVVVQYVFGAVGLMIRADLDVVTALFVTNAPFVIGDVIKVVLAAVIAAPVLRAFPDLRPNPAAAKKRPATAETVGAAS